MTAMLTEAEAGAMAVAKVVDARGAACPGPLLEAKKSMAAVAMGEILEVWSSDPQTKTDVAAWAAKVGHEFLGAAPAQGYDRVFIRRGK
jgi:tRNA 2-thiouridine synthesizing protein A